MATPTGHVTCMTHPLFPCLQDVLLQHQRNVSEVFHKKLQASGLTYSEPDESHDISVGSHDTSVGSCDLSEDSITPNAIEDIEAQEFGPKFRFEAQVAA